MKGNVPAGSEAAAYVPASISVKKSGKEIAGMEQAVYQAVVEKENDGIVCCMR